jgi:hypothetical protein
VTKIFRQNFILIVNGKLERKLKTNDSFYLSGPQHTGGPKFRVGFEVVYLSNPTLNFGPLYI